MVGLSLSLSLSINRRTRSSNNISDKYVATYLKNGEKSTQKANGYSLNVKCIKIRTNYGKGMSLYLCHWKQN